MSRFSNEPSIRALLYEQFNARLCLVDIYYIYKQLEAHLYHNQEATLLLPVAENTDEIRAFLEKYEYDRLIFDMMSHASICHDLEDSLLAYFNGDMVDVFKKACVHPYQKEKSVNFAKTGLQVFTTDFVADIIRYPLSQFHTEIVKACKMFMKAKEYNDKEGTNFYLEPYSPSFFSQYAQYWVAEKLDLLHFPSRICVG